MVKPRFGRLIKVDIGEIWNTDGEEFIKWLAQSDHVAELSKLLGIQLQVETAEQGFPSYLVCRDAETNYWVLIENPTGVSVEEQFGRILMDAASYSPVHVVWLTGGFSAEQAAFLHWLNLVTDETVNFFAMQVEFWQIGDSAYAPHFNLVAHPQDWTRSASTQAEVQPEARTQAPTPSAFLRQEPEDVLPSAQPGMVRRATGEIGEGPAQGMLGRTLSQTPQSEARPSREARPAARPDHQSNSGHPQALSRQTEDPPPSMLETWENSDTTVTPSGMLRRLGPSSDTEDSPLHRGIASDLSETEQIYLEFWTRFWEDVVQWESDLPPEKPMTQGWVTFPIGREGFYIVAFVNADHNLAGMGLVMEGQESKPHFHLLFREKEAIESGFGSALDWRELPSKEESHIYLHKRDIDPVDRSRWVEYQKWFAETLETFTHVLGTRVRTLNAGDYWAEEAVFRPGS